jgi:hypothetical protein
MRRTSYVLFLIVLMLVSTQRAGRGKLDRCISEEVAL